MSLKSKNYSNKKRCTAPWSYKIFPLSSKKTIDCYQIFRILSLPPLVTTFLDSSHARETPRICVRECWMSSLTFFHWRRMWHWLYGSDRCLAKIMRYGLRVCISTGCPWERGAKRGTWNGCVALLKKTWIWGAWRDMKQGEMIWLDGWN